MDPSPALQTLVDNHRAFLAFLQKRVGDRATAEDILQEAFGKAMARIDQLREGESATAWFYRLLRNAVVDHYRRQAAASRALEAFAAGLPEGEPPAEVEREICACITRLAGTLKPEYAEALQRIEIDGLPVKAFAAEKGITESNAGVRVFRARKALREQLAASCGTCAEHGCLDCTCSSRTGAAPA